MSKKQKYEFNQQSATLRLRQHINEGRVMFTIDDETIDGLFNKQFEADVDYIHDGPDVYYVTDQNDLEKFVDYIESLGLDADMIQIQQYFKEEGGVTSGGEAYLPAMNVSSKKQNPFKENRQEFFIQVDVRDAKRALAIIDDSYSLSNTIKKRGSDVYTTFDVMAAEELIDSLKQNGIKNKNNVEGYVDEDVLSGYKQNKGFRPGHTPDKGGFQYKDLWGLNELDATKVEHEGMNEASTSSNVDELARVEELLAQANRDNSYSVMTAYENRIAILKFIVFLEKKLDKQLPVLSFGSNFGEYLKKELGYTGPIKQNRTGSIVNFRTISDAILNGQNQMAESTNEENEAKLSKSKTNENKLSILREMNQIVDEVFSPQDYQKVLQIIDKIKYTNTALYNKIMDLIDDLYPHDYKEVEKLAALSENYSRFKNETKTRTKPEQFHQAVKSVKRKVEEIHKLYEYMERLKLELSESSDGLKYKKYPEIAIFKIKEAVKALHIKTKKLK